MLLWWTRLALCFGEDMREDTALLARHLERFRHGKTYELSAAEYKTIQTEYLAWVDLRLKGGESVQKMNEELTRANLLSGNDMKASNAGFLGEVSEVEFDGDVIEVRMGVFTGRLCNFDETVALYSRKPLHRIALINAEPAYSHGYYLRALAVGNSGFGKIIGSDWAAASCAGNWNQNILRIDLSRGSSIKSLLRREISVFGGDDMSMSIKNDVVSFDYASGFRDVDILVRKGVARYRVEVARVVRLAPIARSFTGFVDEWLRMDDAEAARWATPAANARHHELTAKFEKESFTLESTANCPGPQAGQAIGVERGTVFRVGGTSPVEMRMLSILDKIPSSCQAIPGRDPLKLLGEPDR